jgi:predicted RNA binding protein YcfA (HicA-like mRNA interferase family)
MRQTGSHVLLWKPGLLRPVVIARHNRELSGTTVSNILRQADISAEEFLKHV